MQDDIEIRVSRPGDRAALQRLYPAAFPDEDLLPVVDELLKDEPNVLSLVATRQENVIGHIAFTRCTVGGFPSALSLLAPLAVAPECQRQGIGTALIHEGMRRRRDEGAVRIYVLGDPAYYGRFGFQPESDVQPPYPLPEDWQGAWQSLGLQDGETGPAGVLSVTSPWRKPELWA